jgi:hypothetical protein
VVYKNLMDVLCCSEIPSTNFRYKKKFWVVKYRGISHLIMFFFMFHKFDCIFQRTFLLLLITKCSMWILYFLQWNMWRQRIVPDCCLAESILWISKCLLYFVQWNMWHQKTVLAGRKLFVDYKMFIVLCTLEHVTPENHARLTEIKKYLLLNKNLCRRTVTLKGIVSRKFAMLLLVPLERYNFFLHLFYFNHFWKHQRFQVEFSIISCSAVIFY